MDRQMDDRVHVFLSWLLKKTENEIVAWNQISNISCFNSQLGDINIQARLGQENLLKMVRWVKWHCPPDTGFVIRTPDVRGRARYLSLMQASHNTEFYEWMEKKHFSLFQTAETEKRAPWKTAVQN